MIYLCIAKAGLDEKNREKPARCKTRNKLCELYLLYHNILYFDIKNRILGWIRAAWWRLYVDFDIVALTDTYRIISDAIIHGPVFDVLRRFDSQMGICP